MPNTREKLMEILADNATCLALGIKSCDECAYGRCEDCYTDALVDHLIANGVTVQQWIPVTERLPEQDELVLCVGKKGGMFLGEIHSFLVGGKRNEVFCYVPNSRGGRYATHWMPLPEPPKGE